MIDRGAVGNLHNWRSSVLCRRTWQDMRWDRTWLDRLEPGWGQAARAETRDGVVSNVFLNVTPHVTCPTHVFSVLMEAKNEPVCHIMSPIKTWIFFISPNSCYKYTIITCRNTHLLIAGSTFLLINYRSTGKDSRYTQIILLSVTWQQGRLAPVWRKCITSHALIQGIKKKRENKMRHG